MHNGFLLRLYNAEYRRVIERATDGMCVCIVLPDVVDVREFEVS